MRSARARCVGTAEPGTVIMHRGRPCPPSASYPTPGPTKAARNFCRRRFGSAVIVAAPAACMDSYGESSGSPNARPKRAGILTGRCRQRKLRASDDESDRRLSEDGSHRDRGRGRGVREPRTGRSHRRHRGASGGQRSDRGLRIESRQLAASAARGRAADKCFLLAKGLGNPRSLSADGLGRWRRAGGAVTASRSIGRGTPDRCKAPPRSAARRT